MMNNENIHLIPQLPNPDLNTYVILDHLKKENEPITLKVNGFKIKDETPKHKPEKAILVLSVKILSDVYFAPYYNLANNGDKLIEDNMLEPEIIDNAKGLNFNLYYIVRLIPFPSSEMAVFIDNDNKDNPEVYDIINYLTWKKYPHMKDNDKSLHINYKGLKQVLDGSEFKIKVIDRFTTHNNGSYTTYLKLVGDNDETE